MSDTPKPLDYASAPRPPWRDGQGAVHGFLVGWGIGFGVMLGCTALMCADEIWLPFAFTFPHAAVATELLEGPATRGPGGGDGAFCFALWAAPLTHALYGALLRFRRRIGLGIAAALHALCFAWSLLLPDPYLA